jgi:hypothetical protein
MAAVGGNAPLKLKPHTRSNLERWLIGSKRMTSWKKREEGRLLGA